MSPVPHARPPSDLPAALREIDRLRALQEKNASSAMVATRRAFDEQARLEKKIETLERAAEEAKAKVEEATAKAEREAQETKKAAESGEEEDAKAGGEVRGTKDGDAKVGKVREREFARGDGGERGEAGEGESARD